MSFKEKFSPYLDDYYHEFLKLNFKTYDYKKIFGQQKDTNKKLNCFGKRIIELKKATKMKALFSVLSLILFSCLGGKGNRLPKINQTEIEIAEIKKNLYDTISVQLNEQQISKFAEIFNADSHAELRKALPKYWVFVKFKNDSVVLYKILDTYIGEKDLYVKTDQVAHFKELYEKNKKTKHLISLK